MVQSSHNDRYDYTLELTQLCVSWGGTQIQSKYELPQHETQKTAVITTTTMVH